MNAAPACTDSATELTLGTMTPPAPSDDSLGPVAGPRVCVCACRRDFEAHELVRLLAAAGVAATVEGMTASDAPPEAVDVIVPLSDLPRSAAVLRSHGVDLPHSTAVRAPVGARNRMSLDGMVPRRFSFWLLFIALGFAAGLWQTVAEWLGR